MNVYLDKPVEYLYIYGGETTEIDKCGRTEDYVLFTFAGRPPVAAGIRISRSLSGYPFTVNRIHLSSPVDAIGA